MDVLSDDIESVLYIAREVMGGSNPGLGHWSLVT